MQEHLYPLLRPISSSCTHDNFRFEVASPLKSNFHEFATQKKGLVVCQKCAVMLCLFRRGVKGWWHRITIVNPVQAVAHRGGEGAEAHLGGRVKEGSPSILSPPLRMRKNRVKGIKEGGKGKITQFLVK